jgi:hypothetical protein
MSDDEIARKLQARADAEAPRIVEFNGPGPFELPKCGRQVSAIVPKGGYFVLQLETEERYQRIFVPISVQALDGLKALVHHLQNNLGLDQTKN